MNVKIKDQVFYCENQSKYLPLNSLQNRSLSNTSCWTPNYSNCYGVCRRKRWV